MLINTLRDVDRLPRKNRPQPAITEAPTSGAALRDVPDALPAPSLSRRNSVSHMEKQVSVLGSIEPTLDISLPELNMLTYLCTMLA